MIDVDEKAMTARSERSFTATPPVLGPTQGNLQTLPSGDALVGWGGTSPRLTEFAADGRTVFDARMRSPGAESYRAYRLPWHATPAERPALAVHTAGGRVIAYASWNGATEVARWEALAGERAGALRPAGRAPRSGFETPVTVHGGPRLVAVQAMAADGRVLARSAAVRAR